jgi:hypothetical protein
MFAREERERKDCDRGEVQFQFLTVTLLFVCFSFEETEERASCTRVEEASDMQARRNDAVWGPLSPQKPKKGTVLGTTFPQMPKQGTVLGIFISPQKANTAAFCNILFPPKSPTRQRFGHFNFPPKAHTTPFWPFFFLPKAHTTPFWGPTFPLNCPRWTRDPPSFFLFWFGLSGLMGLSFYFWHVNILYIGLLYNNGFGLFK